MLPRDLYYLMGRCLSLDERPERMEEILNVIELPSFSWEHFVQMGSNHLVLPALFVKFRNAGLLSHLPAELNDHLISIHQLNVERNRRLLVQAQWLVGLFRESGIHPVLLKGAAVLLEGLYPDPGERIVTDIDCLVRGADLEKAVILLRSHGYAPPPFHPASLPMMHHYPSLFKTGEPAQIEVHQIPVGRRQLKYMDLEPVYTYLYEEPGDHPVTLKGHDQMLVNLIHSQLKDRGQFYARIPLRNIYEFYRFSLGYDPAEIRIRSHRLKAVFNNYLTVAKRLFREDDLFPVRNRIGTRLYLARFDLNKSSRSFLLHSTFVRSALDLLSAYLYILTRATFRKPYRRYLAARLSRPAWYHHHLNVIRKRFQRIKPTRIASGI